MDWLVEQDLPEGGFCGAIRSTAAASTLYLK